MRKSQSSVTQATTSSMLRICASALLLASLLTLGVMSPVVAVGNVKAGSSPVKSAATSAAPVSAAMIPPGPPAAPTVVFDEDFENNTGATVTRLATYTGGPPINPTYTADTFWANAAQCNGVILRFNISAGDWATGNCTTPDVNQARANVMRLADVLGQVDAGVTGGTDASPANGSSPTTRDNHALAQWTTSANGADNLRVLQSSAINLGFTRSRYVSFSVDVAEASCTYRNGAANSRLDFFRVAGATETKFNNAAIQACTDPRVGSYTSPQTYFGCSFSPGNPCWGNGGASVRAGRYFLDQGRLLTPAEANSFVFRIKNQVGSGDGNDHAIDNIRVLDVTPQMEKDFSPATIAVGDTSTLTINVTNTSELGAKENFSFTDNLPSNLTTVATPAASTTCGNGTVVAAGGTITVAGADLAAGQTRCTVTVTVTSNTAGTYINDANNINPSSGVNLPTGPATLTVVDTDFGDAPAGYGTAGASHTNTTGLGIGPVRDAEVTANTSANATGDDANRQDDEDGITAANTTITAAGQSLTIPVRNTTGATATLVGWVDFNRDGDFNDPGEQTASVTVPAGATSASVTWPASAGAVAGASFIRLRIYPGTPASPSPTGAVTGGEIEDHAATIALPPRLTVRKELPSRATAGDQFTVSATGPGATGITTTTTGTQTQATSPSGVVQTGATYTITDAIASGGPLSNYTATIQCVDRSNGSAVVPTAGTGPSWTVSNLANNQDVLCTVTNTPRPAELNVTKTPGTVTGPAADGSYSTTYQVTVTNTGGSAATYTNLIDTPQFGTNLAVDGATWTTSGPGAPAGGTATGAGPFTLAPTGTVGPGQTHTYNLTVRFHFTNTNAASSCGGAGTGLFNRVAIAQTETNPNDNTACVPPPQPPRATITIAKTANPTTVSAVGQTVTYSFLVTNTGNVTLSNVGVNDTQLPPATQGNLSAVTCPVTTLAPAASTTCTATYTVTQADLNNGTINDTATATGTPPNLAPVTSTPSTAVVTTERNPSISVVKTANPTTVGTVGQTVTYSFLVTNTGNVTLSSVGVTDVQLPPATQGNLSAVTCPVSTLAPAASTTCTATYTVTQADLNNGTINDTATARGTSPNGQEVTAQSSATVTVTPQGQLAIVKTANPTTVTTVGQVVDYTFVVTNNSNQTITGVRVVDTFDAPGGPMGTITCPQTTLAPGASTTCTASYTVTQADLDNGQLHNTAIAEGTRPNGSTVTSPPDDATVTVTAAPQLTLVKSASPTTVTAVGQTVTYSFAVTNTGNVTLTGLVVNDTQLAPAGPLNGPVQCPVTTLAPGASTTCTATYTVTQADLDNGTVNNVATATGTPPTGPGVTSPPSPATVTAGQSPALTLVKTATPATVTAVGQTVTYSFAVTNTGNVTVSSLSIADQQQPPAGPLDGAPVCQATTLAPGAATNCSATYTVTQADLDNGEIVNVARANGQSPTGAAVQSPPDDAVVETVSQPSIELEKSASPTTVSAVGDVITYTFEVTNTGNVTVTDLVVDDTQIAPAGALDGPVTCPVTTLAPGASTDCTATYTVTQADLDNGSVNDTATATGQDPGGADVPSNESDATVPVVADPGLTIVKSADPTTVSAVGDQVAYEFEVTNTGNVTITDLTVEDEFDAPAGELDGPVECPETTLAPGASTTCTATYTVTQADLNNGEITNTATASGTPPSGPPVTSPPDDETVDVEDEPELTIVKSAEPASVSAVGDVISYEFEVTNTGNVTLTDVGVDDTQIAPAGALDGPVTCPETSLAPGASTTCTATYTVTQADLDNGSVNDTATATGTPPNGPPVTSDPSDATVPVDFDPALTIVKTADPTTVSAVGDQVTYEFEVTNTGNVTITDLTVEDEFDAPAGDLDGPVECPETALAPGASTTCTATYTVTQADLDNGEITNTATASGTPPSGPPVTSPPDDETVDVEQSPELGLVKSATPATVSAVGDVISYEFEVTNTGNVTITDLTVADEQLAPAGALDGPVTCPETTLAPGASTVCTATYTVTQADLDNGTVNDTATATGDDPNGDPVTSDPSDASVPVDTDPSLEIVKTADPTTVSAVGDEITYTFEVTNTGNVTITDLTVEDEFDAPAGELDGPVECPETALAPGASTTCTATYTVTQDDLDNGEITNTATATGTPPTGPPVTSPPDDETVDVEQTPELAIVKSADPTTVSAVGDQVAYEFEVTNTGNVTITDLTVEDEFDAPAGELDGPVECPETTLAPGASTTCTATYTLTQADLDNGEITNTATATGTPPSGPPVTSPPDDETVDVEQSPELALEKSASPTTVSAVGDVVTYTFDVTNTGNVTITDLVVDDIQIAPAGDLDGPVDCPDTTLTPGESVECTATYTVTQADLDNGSISDTATATGDDPNGDPISSPPSDATVTAEQDPDLTVEKSADPATVSTVGEQVTYEFEVTNTGNVTLTGIEVDDQFDAPAGELDGPVECPETALAPGASTTCTASYTVTQADLDNGEITNTATATGTPPSGPPVTSPPDDETVDVEQTPELALVKSADPTTVSAAGQQVTYSFLVTNTGNVMIGDLSIADEQAPPAGPLDAAPVCPDTTLAPGASTTCTATYTVTQADIDHGTITNTATAVGTAPQGDPVESNESQAVVTAEQSPAIDILKSGTPEVVTQVGDVITYTFTVTNTGNVTLTDIVVDDVQSAPAGELDGPVACPTTTLAPGESTDCTATYTVTRADLEHGEVHDVATATGTPPSGDPVTSPESPLTIPADAPSSFEASKTSDPADGSQVKPGQVITYTLKVENTGETVLTAPVTDNLSDVLDDATYNKDAESNIGTVTFDRPTLRWSGSIEPGETLTITYSVTVKPYAAQGDHQLNNAVVVHTPGGPCGVEGPAAAKAAPADSCGTTHSNPPPDGPDDPDNPDLPDTGGPDRGFLIGGLLAALLGAALIVASTRRRRTH